MALYGEVFDDATQTELAASKSKEEIVDLLLSDPRFSDAVLDFNYYFLNLKVRKIYQTPSPGLKNYFIFEKISPALGSARAFSRNENYFRLFDYNQPFFHHGISTVCKTIDGPDTMVCTEWLSIQSSSREEVNEAKKKWTSLAVKSYTEAILEIESLPEDANMSEILIIYGDKGRIYRASQQL